MTRDEVIALAREAGGGLSCIAEPLEHPWKFSERELIRFAALVAAHEREECAKVCEDEGERVDASWMSCAAAIRGRT